MEGGCGLWSTTKCALLDISIAYEVRIHVVIPFDGGGSLAVVHTRACTVYGFPNDITTTLSPGRRSYFSLCNRRRQF